MTRSTRPFTAELQLARREGRPIEAETVIAQAPVAAADLGPILSAIQGLDGKIERMVGSDHQEIERIRTEISDIAGRIRTTKAEIAQLRHPLASDDKLTQASSQLGEVVSATEAATNGIMSAAEQIDEAVAELKTLVADGYQMAKVNDIADQVVRIYEACNFQDLTGQRITKVVRTLAFIEERVANMMAIWGEDELKTMPLPPSIEKRDGDMALHGPAGDEAGNASQADIDKLFG